jgi:hypothetical protein
MRAIIALVTEAASISETSVNFYQTTWRNNPEDSHLHKLSVFDNRVPGKICRSKKDEVTGGRRKLHNEEIYNLHTSQNIIRIGKGFVTEMRPVEAG